MRLSASSLKKFTKCGHAWYREKVEHIDEPGRKAFGMFQGRVLGDALAEASVYLNQIKRITEAEMGVILYRNYVKHFEANKIPGDLLPWIQKLLLEGLDPDTMNHLDILSVSFNDNEFFEFKVPAAIKDLKKTKGGYSSDKKRMGMQILNSFESFIWFFEEGHPHYTEIRDAIEIEHERHFKIEIAPGVEVDGYFDQFLVLADGTPRVYEWKTDKTAYSEDLTGRLIQTVTYAMASDNTIRVGLVDLRHNNVFSPPIQPHMIELTRKRYLQMAKAIEHEIFTPACGTDPYFDAKILCGHKCGGCPFGTVDNTEVEDYAA